MTPIRVLVVEDEPLMREAHAGYVDRVPGFVTQATAATVREARTALESQPIDLVLLDLNLPDGHGLDVVRALRAAARPVDVVAVTAARDLPVVRAAVSLGVVQYVLKPFTFAALADRLRAYAEYRGRFGETGAVTQDGVDLLLADLHRVPDRPLPKGLSRVVLDRVTAALSDAAARASGEGLSASEVAAVVEVSRVTARRYLEHLAEAGLVTRDQRGTGSGRPELVFRWRA